ncbi:MAG: 3-keto-5-aminohexanoate cleavage protein [Oscillospiraceae bacterium]|nr:3-keto-5-aminohexanoate cleavage protein [Oscillospiraceae bacterium]
MAAKTIISCAMTGTGTPKSKNSALPTTPEEIAEDVYQVWKAGAAIVHLHMREDDQTPTMDAGRFAETIRLIRAHEDCDVIINCTSSGSNTLLPPEKRMEHFVNIPDIELGSFDAGTINWDCTGIFLNDPPFLLKLAECYEKYHVKPEIELFDAGMIANMNYYIRTGVLKEPVWCQLVMNVLGGAPGTVENLVHLVNQLPKGAMWSCTGIGASHVPLMFATLALGGHLRVGLEDNLYFSKGVKATNEMLVARAVRVVKEFGNEPATPAEAREMLGLPQLVR